MMHLSKSFKEKTQLMKVGNPADPEVFVGPLINKKQLDKVQGWIDESILEGAICIQRGNVTGTLMDLLF